MKDCNDIKVKLTPKSCNSIAYSLVRLVIEKCETVVWVDSLLRSLYSSTLWKNENYFPLRKEREKAASKYASKAENITKII